MKNLFNHAYPYLDEHELNLDWLIAKMKELQIQFDEFKVVNNITFSGQWDITKQYPAWTIVSDNNIGYVSLQPVPVGVVLTNGDYWVEVIDYTAQIAGLQTRVIALENTVGDASSGLVHDVDELQSTTIKKKRRFILWDSYGGYPNDNLSAKLCELIGVTYTPESPVISGNHDNRFTGGIGFTNANGQGTFTTFLTSIISEIDDLDEIDEVIVFGGANDYGGNVTDIQNGIDAFITYVGTVMPNAKVRIGCLSAARYSRASVEAHLIAINAYRSCVNYGAEYLYNTEYIMHNYGLTVDGIHPANNTSVTNGIAYKLANAILNGNCEVNYFGGTNLSPTTPTGSFDTLTLGTGVFNASVSNGVTTANMFIYGQLTRSDGTTINLQNYDFEIAQIPDDYKFIVGRAANTRPYIMNMPITVYAYKTGNLVEKDTAYAYVDENGNLRCTLLFGWHGGCVCDTVKFLGSGITSNNASEFC